jgi:hypothetical protein
MRHIARVLSGIVLAACYSQSAIAADSTSTSSSWWPWGKQETKKSDTSTLGTGNSAQLGKPQTSGSVARPSLGAAQPPLSGSSTAKDQTDSKDQKDHWMLSSPSGKVSWPHLTMPKMPSMSSSATDTKKPADTKHNSWVEKTPTPPKTSSPMKSVTDEAHKVSKATKDAWHKTVKAVTPSSSTPAKSETDNSPRLAKKEMDPPWYKKMFGAKTELQQPQTVPQWMAQQRLDP